MSFSLTTRLRRLRQSTYLRDLVRETTLTHHDLILPLFIKTGHNIKKPIAAMPGHYQWSLDRLKEILSLIKKAELRAVILFGIPKEKNTTGSESLKNNGIIQQAIQYIKTELPQLIVITDVCLCGYTSHSHCGILSQKTHGNKEWVINNDETLKTLAKQAISYAKAGADIIAPSSMMDGMVTVIRQALDQAHYNQIPILSYAVKYASHLYTPFREAAETPPQFGDRSSYQMDPANTREALREAQLDIAEGADFLMIKPATLYLDILYRIKNTYPHIPLWAYQVSGEFAMIKAAAKQGWLNEKQIMIESLLSIKRAGGDCIITYYALEAAFLLQSNLV